MPAQHMRTGGQIIVDHLVGEDVRHLFMVPGESFLGLLDAVHSESRLRPVTARHESAAAMMAEATGKLTGKPGVAVVTRGPGAANALAGVYIAAQDQTPMVLLVGMPPRSRLQLPAFQQIDLVKLFGGIAKNVAIADSASTLTEQLTFAFRLAVSGRPGPVVVGLPEDVLAEMGPATEAHCRAPVHRAVAEQDIQALQDCVSRARRPLIIVGSPMWSQAASEALARFADTFGLPVATSFRRQDRFDNSNDSYVGHLGFVPHTPLAEAVSHADVVIAFGACLDDITTRGFTLVPPQADGRTLVLVSPDAVDPRSCPPYAPDLAIAACPMEVVHTLAGLPPPRSLPWRDWRRALRSAYELSLAGDAIGGRLQNDTVPMGEIATHLTHRLSVDTIICNGAGHYAASLQRYYVYRHYPSQLAPLSGSMGYGLPAAIAAKLAFPDREVVAVAGDGCFQMTGAELATAVQLELPITVIVANNNTLGSIQFAQLQSDPARVIATTLINPNFALQAAAAGARGFCVNSMGAFADALEQALRFKGPTVIEVATT
ncbi:MAG: thiamine pyrophosphate-binding protein [Hyphomicrobiaceae bacterium]